MQRNVQRSATGAEMDTRGQAHDPAPRQAYDVIVIGAGWSGLMACKYCLAEGSSTLVLEGRDSIGGVWAFTPDPRVGGVMKTTETTSSRCLTEISDFPMPADYPSFPSNQQIAAYLEAYCDRFSLTEHIRFRQRVTRVAKLGDLWEVTTSDGSRQRARHVIVCSGLHQFPNDMSGDERFAGYAGTLMHSAAVKDIPAEWSGNTIVVWGGGESASDIACEASKVASRVYFCIPNGVWFVHKRLNGWPPLPSSEPKILDHITSRLRLWLSPTHQYSPFVYEYLEWAFGFNGHGQEPWRTEAPYQRSFLNKSADVLSRVGSGHVVPKRDVVSCRGTTLRFTDGTRANVDTIITCSGYTPVFPFLPASVPAGTDPRRWFKYVFYNEDPSLAFVGFARPLIGSIPGLAELQSRYVARVFSGACRLPEPAERRAITERDARFWDHQFRDTSLRIGGLVDHFVYADQLARLIGCRPKFAKLFFSSPRRWWRAVTAPWNGCQFWLNDPRHHDRIFATFRRYFGDRVAQVWIFLLLAPVLPLLLLRRRLKISLRDHLSHASRARRVERRPAGARTAAGVALEA